MRPPLRLRRPLAVAATTALLLALTACGGDDGEKASDEPSVSESSETPEDSGEQSEAGEQVDPADFVADMKAGLEASTTANLTMDVRLPSGGLEIKGQVDYATRPPSMAMTMVNEMMGDQPLDFRLVKGVMYINMGTMSNDKFLKFDLSDTENLPPGMEGLQGQMDPLAAFKDMEDALKSVTYVGTEDVDGEELGHYALVLDTTKMDSVQGMTAESGMPPEVEYEMYVDDQFRIRQLDMTMEAEQPVELTGKFFDWGTDVKIEAPPANQVVDAATIAG